MMLVTAALSISGEIDRVGALAGLAAIVGIAVLGALYAAQAREVKRLRDWAGRSPERDAEAVQRISEEAARPAPATAAATAGAAAAAPATAAGRPRAPVTPAPVVAKSATGAIPGSSPKTAGKPVPGAKPTTGAVPAVAKATPPAAAAILTPPAAKTPAPAAPAAPAAKPPAAPAPARPAPPPVRPRPRTVAPARNATDEITLPPPRPPASRVAAGKAADSAGGRRSLLLVIVGAVAIIVIAFVLITQVFGGSDSSSPAPQPNSVGPAVTTATPTTPDAAAGAVDRANTQVAVFNGTTGAGLARAAADKLQAAGFTKVGPVTTAPDQATATTSVYYDTGSKAAADEVATTLGLSSTAVMAIDQTIKVLGQNAVVVVVLGADQAQ